VLRTTDNPCVSRDIDIPSSGQWNSRTSFLRGGVTDSSTMVALSMEFVAKPREAHRFQSLIPWSLSTALKRVRGFAGCLVMVSDQEARLVTVVTLWAGEDARKRCAENARWVQTLLTPLIDRQLRIQYLTALMPALPANRAETCSAEEGSIPQALPLQKEEVRAA
jgi:hypothetical protein